MQKKVTIAAIVVLFLAMIGCGVAYFSIVVPQKAPQADTYIVSEGELSEAVRDQMEKVLSSPGAYTFDGEYKVDETILSGRFVLLTAGLVSNYEMGVEFEPEGTELVNFAVSMLDNNSAEQYLYKLFFTTAERIAVNEAALQNPAMRVGTTGFNQGYLERYGDGYYIIPILDEQITNHVYQAGIVGSILENGLYEFTYEVTNQGTILTSAQKINEITKKAYVAACSGNGMADLVFGKPRNKLTVTYDMGNSTWNRDLVTLAELGAYQTGQFTLTYEDNRVTLKNMQATMPVLDEIDLGG